MPRVDPVLGHRLANGVGAGVGDGNGDRAGAGGAD